MTATRTKWTWRHWSALCAAVISALVGLTTVLGYINSVRQSQERQLQAYTADRVLTQDRIKDLQADIQYLRAKENADFRFTLEECRK